ncbi:unnamed protein product [Moneuplotes crassus]|uniref:Uncharacterized protein n=1 Tax=Euplotes crassus TaxID=5936 RepID=A0AAD2D653_EUPCR|nr:unnamed protein product [Moneuplotes crassus]
MNVSSKLLISKTEKGYCSSSIGDKDNILNKVCDGETDWSKERMEEEITTNCVYDSLYFPNKLAEDKGYHINSNKEENKNEYKKVILPPLKSDNSGILSIHPLSSIQEAPSIDEASNITRLIRFKSRQVYLKPPTIPRLPSKAESMAAQYAPSPLNISPY